MAYVTVGAWIDVSAGQTMPSFQRPASKAALRRALSAQLSTQRAVVVFSQTSMFPSDLIPLSFTGDKLATIVPTYVNLSVVGPDPETNRRWYATVSVSANGTVKVS